MKKYRVRFHPIVVDVFADDERGAMGVVWDVIDNLQWDEYNVETIAEYDGGMEDFYPVNFGDAFGTCDHDWWYSDSGDGTMVCHLGCGSIRMDA